MEYSELKIMRGYPLDVKVAKTKVRIREWVKHWGEDHVYISFSGGKDSTVLLDIARQEYPNIKAVFSDTGLEYPEIKEFVKKFDNVEILRPKRSFKTVLMKYGYPVVSKEVSASIYELRNSKSEKLIHRRLYGDKNGRYKLPYKWRYLQDAPFKISNKCCYHLKKSPLDRYCHRTERYCINAMLAEESMLRLNNYLRHGCNAFNSKNPKSQPLAFWTNQDILQYIVEHDLEIASCYGEIKQDEDGKYYMDGVDRTGCIFCPFGCHRDKTPNRFQMLHKSHPELYDYCINGGEFDEDGNWTPNNEGLGFGFVLDYLNLEY